MIEKTDFGDPLGGTVAGCSCNSGDCATCNCSCHWWANDSAAQNFNTHISRVYFISNRVWAANT